MKLRVALIATFFTLAGLGGGVLLASSPPASAQARFTECTSATMWVSSGRDLNAGNPAQAVRIPAGWTPIGGGGVRGMEPVLIICR